MGLDGISINQLRVDSELNTNETNKLSENKTQFIDGLSKGQRINSDDKKEKDHSKKQNNQEDEDDEENDIDELNENEELNDKEELNNTKQTNEAIKDFSKYNLSDAKKYILRADEKTNNILVIEKSSEKVIQSFSPETLENLTKHLKDSTGTIINRKY